MNNILNSIDNTSQSSNRPTWCGPEPVLGVLDLSRNTCYDHRLKIMIQEWMKDLSGDVHFQYPDERVLQQHISMRHEVSIDNVTIGLGSCEILNRVFWLLTGRTVHVVSPTFQMVDVLAKQHKCKTVHMNYTNFNQFDIDSIPSDSIVYIANPNGNNGHSFDIDQIEHIRNKCELLILDEAYMDFADSPHTTLCDNVIVLKTFSKSLCLPGARCGYAITTKNNSKALQHYRPSIVTTTMACELIPRLLPEMDQHIERMNACKQYMNEKFDHVHSSGNYVLVNAKQVENIQSFKYKIINKYARIALTDKYTMTRLTDGY